MQAISARTEEHVDRACKFNYPTAVFAPCKLFGLCTRKSAAQVLAVLHLSGLCCTS